MLLGRYSISQHAIAQYDDRVEFKHGNSIKKSIRYDLRTLNIKYIVRTVEDGEYKTHVFTKGFKEFVFVKNKQGFLNLKTVIKRNRDETIKAYNKLLKNKKTPEKLSC